MAGDFDESVLKKMVSPDVLVRVISDMERCFDEANISRTCVTDDQALDFLWMRSEIMLPVSDNRLPDVSAKDVDVPRHIPQPTPFPADCDIPVTISSKPVPAFGLLSGVFDGILRFTPHQRGQVPSSSVQPDSADHPEGLRHLQHTQNPPQVTPLQQLKNRARVMPLNHLVLRYLTVLSVVYGAKALAEVSPRYALVAERTVAVAAHLTASHPVSDLILVYESVLAERSMVFRPYLATPPVSHSVFLPIYALYVWIAVVRNS